MSGKLFEIRKIKDNKENRGNEMKKESCKKFALPKNIKFHELKENTVKCFLNDDEPAFEKDLKCPKYTKKQFINMFPENSFAFLQK